MRLWIFAIAFVFGSVVAVWADGDWQVELRKIMLDDYGCIVDKIVFVTFTATDGNDQIFATVECKNTRSFSVSRTGKKPFKVNR